jgi:GTP-binding protein
VLDATEGIVALDATIAGYAHEGGRAVIICVNKWDEKKGTKQSDFERDIRDHFKFLDYAPVKFMSAKTGQGVPALFKAGARGARSGVQAHRDRRDEPVRRTVAF